MNNLAIVITQWSLTRYSILKIIIKFIKNNLRLKSNNIFIYNNILI